jgi:hypothetical protein
MSFFGWLLAVLRTLASAGLSGLLVGFMFLVWFEQREGRRQHTEWARQAHRPADADDDKTPEPVTADGLKDAVKAAVDAVLHERAANAVLLEAAAAVSAATLARPPRPFVPGSGPAAPAAPIASLRSASALGGFGMDIAGSDEGVNPPMGPPREPPRRSARVASPAAQPRFRFTVGSNGSKATGVAGAAGPLPADSSDGQGRPFDDNATF